MSDIHCPKCGEPWDSYEVFGPEVDAMTPAERARFRRGDGCPSCDWGAKAKDRPKRDDSGFLWELAEGTDRDILEFIDP